MNFELKLNLPDAEQEADWLNERIREEEIPGLTSGILVAEEESGTLSGGVFTGVLILGLKELIKQGIGSLFTVLFNHFDGKKASFELTGECPDSGKSFTLTFDNTTAKGRDKAYKEFTQRFEAICGKE